MRAVKCKQADLEDFPRTLLIAQLAYPNWWKTKWLFSFYHDSWSTFKPGGDIGGMSNLDDSQVKLSLIGYITPVDIIL